MADAISSLPQRVLLEGIVVLYCFALGSTIGSFLNVVIYRLPRGMNIARPGSRCPACHTPIRLRDNVPVVSWLLLRGRCRHCGSRISLRYLLVEAAVGLLFVFLLYVEVLSGGRNLPFHRPSAFADDVLSIHWNTRWHLVAIALYHACLLVVLLAGALIQHDRLRVPWRLFVCGLLIGPIAPVAWPVLRPVSASGFPTNAAEARRNPPGTLEASVDEGRLSSLGAAAAGGGLGLALGTALAWLMVRRPESVPEPAPLFELGQCPSDGGDDMERSHTEVTAAPEARLSTALGMATIGVFLGWQAAIGVAAITLPILLLAETIHGLLPHRRRLPPLAVFFAATMMQIAYWGRFLALLNL